MLCFIAPVWREFACKSSNVSLECLVALAPGSAKALKNHICAMLSRVYSLEITDYTRMSPQDSACPDLLLGQGVTLAIITLVLPISLPCKVLDPLSPHRRQFFCANSCFGCNPRHSISAAVWCACHIRSEFTFPAMPVSSDIWPSLDEPHEEYTLYKYACASNALLQSFLADVTYAERTAARSALAVVVSTLCTVGYSSMSIMCRYSETHLYSMHEACKRHVG